MHQRTLGYTHSPFEGILPNSRRNEYEPLNGEHGPFAHIMDCGSNERFYLPRGLKQHGLEQWVREYQVQILNGLKRVDITRLDAGYRFARHTFGHRADSFKVAVVDTYKFTKNSIVRSASVERDITDTFDPWTGEEIVAAQYDDPLEALKLRHTGSLLIFTPKRRDYSHINNPETERDLASVEAIATRLKSPDSIAQKLLALAFGTREVTHRNCIARKGAVDHGIPDVAGYMFLTENEERKEEVARACTQGTASFLEDSIKPYHKPNNAKPNGYNRFMGVMTLEDPTTEGSERVLFKAEAQSSTRKDEKNIMGNAPHDRYKSDTRHALQEYGKKIPAVYQPIVALTNTLFGVQERLQHL